MWADYFEADYSIIHSTGRLYRVRDFAQEVTDYNFHPANRGLLRRLFRIRLSTTKLRRLLKDTLRNETASPFGQALDQASGILAE